MLILCTYFRIFFPKPPPLPPSKLRKKIKPRFLDRGIQVPQTFTITTAPVRNRTLPEPFINFKLINVN